ncbi:MAG: Rieske (2Fe-2S) protein [Deltaproteobacteria bacterium]|nr:MAG: Rieske (2Fe-2S) protein [Deltaproteobacteria bacterium]
MSEDANGRRGFLQVVAGLSAAAVGALAAIPGVGVIIDPLLRRRKSAGGFLPIGDASQLSDDGPVSLPVIGELVDAWTRAPEVQLGTVWLQKGEGDEVKAMTAECPHLGCKIGYDGEQDHFYCPCHKSSFGLDGSVNDGPSPRAMDPLEARVRDGVIEVRFKRFRTQGEEPVEIG